MKVLPAVIAALLGLMALSSTAAPLPQSTTLSLTEAATPAGDEEKDKDKEKKD